MPGDPGATVVTNARAYYSTRAAAGATGARHSPLPLGVAPRPLLGEESLHNSGALRCGNAKLCSPDAADPGSMLKVGCLWVPALRCIVKNAAPRPGHVLAGARNDDVAIV